MPAQDPNSSHMMKTTKRGRPFLKVCHSLYSNSLAPIQCLQDTLDLFATLVVSLELITNRQYFRTFPNSFTTCVLRLASCAALLTFSPAMMLRGIWRPSSSLNRTAGQILVILLVS